MATTVLSFDDCCRQLAKQFARSHCACVHTAQYLIGANKMAPSARRRAISGSIMLAMSQKDKTPSG